MQWEVRHDWRLSLSPVCHRFSSRNKHLLISWLPVHSRMREQDSELALRGTHALPKDLLDVDYVRGPHHVAGWPHAFFTAARWCEYRNHPFTDKNTEEHRGDLKSPKGPGRGRAVFELSWTGSGKHLLGFYICGLQVAAADFTHSRCGSTGLGAVPRLQLRQHWVAACFIRRRLESISTEEAN